MKNNIEIAVVGHDPSKFPIITSPILKPAILHDLSFDKPHYSYNSLGESRFFLANNFFQDSSDIVGCLTTSWDKKYQPNKLNDILSWPQSSYFDKITENSNIVLCTTLCYGKHSKPNAPLWESNFQAHFRKMWIDTYWIQDLIYKITGLKYNQNNIAPYANQLICHKTLFIKFVTFIKNYIDDIILYFGLHPRFIGSQIDPNRTLAYIMEEISMLWWSQQANITYISCGSIIPGWYK